jgi:hypothetical protein
MTSRADAPTGGELERAPFVPLRARGPLRTDSVTFRGLMTTEDHIRGGKDTGGTRLREPSASVRLRNGTAAERPLRQLTAGEVVAAAPWRSARSACGQAHYPGYFWSLSFPGKLPCCGRPCCSHRYEVWPRSSGRPRSSVPKSSGDCNDEGHCRHAAAGMPLAALEATPVLIALGLLGM